MWFLFTVFILNFIECQDICSFLKPNGTFNGIQVYKWYSNSGYTYRMFNSEGTDWEFHYDNDNNTISADINTLSNDSIGLTKRFFIEAINQNNDKQYFNCFVKQSVI